MNVQLDEMALEYLRLDTQLKETQEARPSTRPTQSLKEAHSLAWVRFAAVLGTEHAETYLRRHGERLNAQLDSEG
ncbi:hypothetical protein [Lentzea sp. NPDC059081]|uniref:hypothetical protein n=1 Tax=Lentzea sp. NPDC059081 TaxID=3346719 RepID=UPI0036AEBEF7